MSTTINYAVEMRSGKTGLESHEFGFTTDGIFRWITGRPSYNGNNQCKWEDGSGLYEMRLSDINAGMAW